MGESEREKKGAKRLRGKNGERGGRKRQEETGRKVFGVGGRVREKEKEREKVKRNEQREM